MFRYCCAIYFHTMIYKCFLTTYISLKPSCWSEVSKIYCIFSPCVISTLLHLLTILPFLKYAQRDHLRHWTLPADNHGKKSGGKNGGKCFPVYSTSEILLSIDKTKTSHCVQICVFPCNVLYLKMFLSSQPF